MSGTIISGFWTGLLANLATVAVVISIWTNLRDRLPALPPRTLSLVFGTVMGTGAAATILLPIEIEPGLIADLRIALLAVTGFFGGPIAAIVAGVVAIICRAAVGGIGAPAGCLAIVIVAAVGLVGQRLASRRATRESDIVLLALAATVGAALALVVLPKSAWPAIEAHLEAFIGITFASTALVGFAILQDGRRRALLERETIYRAIIEALPDCLNIKDLDGRFIAANPATARLMRAQSPSDLVGKTDFDFFPSEVAQSFHEDEARVLAGGVPVTIDQKVYFDGGTETWCATLKAPIRDDKGHVVGLITHNRDVTAERALQEELKTTRQRLEDALEHMADALVLYDRDGRILLRNSQYLRLFPLTADLRVPGARLLDILRAALERGELRLAPGVDVEAWIAERCRINLAPGDRLIQMSDGRWLATRTRPASDGNALILFADITDRKRAEDELALANAQLAQLALTDSLTGLVNRRGLDQALEKEFARGQREGTALSVLLLDVDRFKAYNDNYGHQAGDACLAAIAGELQAIVRRPADLAARYGGEEFAVLLPNTPTSGALELAERLRLAVRLLRMPHSASEYGVVTVSIGVTTQMPGQWIKQAQGLLSRADVALYDAKAAGRDKVHIDARSLGRPVEGVLAVAS